MEDRGRKTRARKTDRLKEMEKAGTARGVSCGEQARNASNWKTGIPPVKTFEVLAVSLVPIRMNSRLLEVGGMRKIQSSLCSS